MHRHRGACAGRLTIPVRVPSFGMAGRSCLWLPVNLPSQSEGAAVTAEFGSPPGDWARHRPMPGPACASLRRSKPRRGERRASGREDGIRLEASKS